MTWVLVERFIGYIEEIGKEELTLYVNSMDGEEATAILPIDRIPIDLQKNIEVWADIEIRILKNSSTRLAQWKVEYALARRPRSKKK